MIAPIDKSPRVGCGAMITNSMGEILLVKRCREPEAQYWGFPGGKVDFGETVEAAIRREIREELAIEINLQGLVHIVNYIDLDAEQHWVAPVYKAVISTGHPVIQEGDILSEWAWFAVDALPTPLTEATSQTIKNII